MNKKILFLLWIYTSWVIITLLYNKKNPTIIQNELEKTKKSNKSDLKILFNNFIEIHKNLLNDLKDKTLTQENKKLFETKKDKLKELAWENIKKYF